MAFMFENLEVYQKAVDFADRIASKTEAFPRGYYFLVDQLNRAALSVVTNLAEGNGRFTKPDWRNFFGIDRHVGLNVVDGFVRFIYPIGEHSPDGLLLVRMEESCLEIRI